ncbi:MAG: hypothetical protein AseanaTS_27070 [Candidatus Pelagadaptatus aseana]
MLTYGGLHGVNLAVAVGGANVIHVHQRDFPYPAACQCFGHPGAYTTYTYDCKVTVVQVVERSLSVQSGYTAEALLVFI